MRFARSAYLFAALGLLTTLPEAGAQEYPTSTVRIVSGFGPGSTADITARIVGNRMGQSLGQQFIVENRLGAASSTAAASVARAPKDGYTLFIVSVANLTNHAMNPGLTFDIVKDFAPIALLTSTPTVLVVTPETGVRSVQELVEKARREPGKLLFGSSGVASSTHFALEQFKSLAKLDITHVPYTGSPPVVTDLIGGRIHGYFSPASSVIELVRAGKLLALAVTDAQRSSVLPDLSTMIEAGVAGFESTLWFGLVAPAGTPQPIIDKLSKAANEALASDEVSKPLRAQYVATIGGTPANFAAFIDTQLKHWTSVVATVGLTKK